MPISFQFLLGDEPQRLNAIDREMCEDLGIKEDPDQFCELFLSCQWLGSSTLVQTNGKVDLEKLNHYLDNNTSRPENEKELLRKYLCGKYTFTAWWSAR